MENRGLLFIPDISGFTRFVNQTDIEHSRLIIQELLEVLINANQTGLVVSEIEGDAILFYKFGDKPSLETIYKQVEKMFCEFHRRLIMYDNHRFCQCTACNTAAGLTLKVITHYGEFTGYTVKNFSKLIGKDVIVAHQLLKNDIEYHEYWLVTDNLFPDGKIPGFSEWMKWDHSQKQTETGDIEFHYTQIGALKDQLEPEQPLELELTNKKKVLTFSREYDTEIIALFHAVGDFRYRHEWQDGVTEVQELSHFLPRVGMKYKVISGKRMEVIFASSYTFDPEKIEFSETDEKKSKALYYRLDKLSDTRTRLTIDYYINKSLPGSLRFQLFEKNSLKKRYERSLEKLVPVAKAIVLTG